MNQKNRVGNAMRLWRKKHWPPKKLRQYKEGLELYWGYQDEVFEYWETLAAVTGPADHIAELGGYKPRWLGMPKFEFGVLRLNLVQTWGKTSRRFTSLAKLMERCGSFDEQEQQAILTALANNPDHILVAHQAIPDIRAFIFTARDRKPKRVRFKKNGLVIAVDKAAEEGFLIQDHIEQIRTQRKDAYSTPIAKNEKWAVYVLPASVVKTRPRKGRRDQALAVLEDEHNKQGDQEDSPV